MVARVGLVHGIIRIVADQINARVETLTVIDVTIGVERVVHRNMRLFKRWGAAGLGAVFASWRLNI